MGWFFHLTPLNDTHGKTKTRGISRYIVDVTAAEAPAAAVFRRKQYKMWKVFLSDKDTCTRTKIKFIFVYLFYTTFETHLTMCTFDHFVSNDSPVCEYDLRIQNPRQLENMLLYFLSFLQNYYIIS